MFSNKLTRAAHRATAAAINSSTAASRSTTCIAARRTHQRRHSSSKASCPPDSNTSGGKPAPATKASNVEEDKSHISPPTSQQRGGKRVSRPKRSRSVGSADKVEDQFAGLPAVPGTQHLSYADFSVSSFFSLHRPLSLSSTIPPSATTEAFDNIFESRKEVDPWENGNSAERRPEDVVYALGSLFDNIDGAANESQDDGVRWEVIQESPSNQDGAVKHLDGPPRVKSLDEQIAEFRPFKAPPPPHPFPQEEQKSGASKRKASKPKQQSYEMRIILTENTNSSGERTYTASSSPIIRIENPEQQSKSIQEPAQKGQARHPFKERMQERQRAFQLRNQGKIKAMTNAQPMIRKAPSARRGKMLLISVKRQRKLKMKKHKYKKLMKRTRNLRRRQDRA
ncbi:hypothetical protein M409DRAFT_20299 [Zasmidium cellare ATCC 36951]|uniref:Small ribosomal subunit protein mS38 n=1 Tax=Zasmidium cellare ATCC 36951 TaxID=1080233 RepID=A0A6A6CS37_ZASCE|nr:uncharacterized protein M409DRAFT_20299 [Zasmidium cellare ATCC 36951]KAF2169885.1 hypothetical protein M409DRAFT_20299 [Zasmidium cellare ATCC 36951]